MTMIPRLHAVAALAVAFLAAAPALAGPDYSPSKKLQYPSPNLNRADADTLVLRGTGSTGEIPGMTVNGAPLSSVIDRQAGKNIIRSDTFSGNPAASLAAPAPIIDLRSTTIEGFSGSSSLGSQFSFCTWLGCDRSRDIMVVQNLTQGKSTRGALNNESQFFSDYFINTGYVPLWRGSTSYAAGGYATNASGLYQALTSGTSAASGGPTGTGQSIADGSVTWKYVQNANDTNNKTNFSLTTYVGPNAANSWGMATNVHIDPGVKSQTIIGHENDMSNDGPDCTSNLRNCFLHFGYVNGPGTITAFSFLSAAGRVTPLATDNSSGGAAFNGIVIDGGSAIRNYSFVDSSNSKAAFRCEPGTRKNEACLFDFSNGNTGVLIKGTKGYAAIDDGSTGPYGLMLEGNYSTAAMRYKNFLLGDRSDYTALSFNQSLASGSMMGFFGKPGDTTLYSDTPGAFEQRIANATVSRTDATQANFFVPISSTSLAGTGTRYACVNSSGRIFASATICQ